MELIRRQDWVVAFSNAICGYGKRIWSGMYRLELYIPFKCGVIPIWHSKKKPAFRNLVALYAIWCVPYVIISILMAIVTAIYLLTCQFFITTLFQKTFINDSFEIVSGYFSLIMSLIGYGAVIYWIFH